jgi:hypothetical protein
MMFRGIGICLFTALSACVSGVDTDDGVDTVETGETGYYLGSSVYSGTLVDEDGAPLPNLRVTLCGGVCLIDTTSLEGEFYFENVLAGRHVLETGEVPGEDKSSAVESWSRAFDIVEIGEGVVIAREAPFVAMQVSNGIPLTGELATYELTDNLKVTVSGSEFGVDHPLPLHADRALLGAVELPKEFWPTGGYDGWRIDRAWSLVLWDLESEDSFAVEATLTEELDEQHEVGFLVANYTYGFQHGEFVEEQAVLDANGLTVSTPSAGGLNRATMWLLVVK